MSQPADRGEVSVHCRALDKPSAGPGPGGAGAHRLARPAPRALLALPTAPASPCLTTGPTVSECSGRGQRWPLPGDIPGPALPGGWPGIRPWGPWTVAVSLVVVISTYPGSINLGQGHSGRPGNLLTMQVLGAPARLAASPRPGLCSVESETHSATQRTPRWDREGAPPADVSEEDPASFTLYF